MAKRVRLSGQRYYEIYRSIYDEKNDDFTSVKEIADSLGRVCKSYTLETFKGRHNFYISDTYDVAFIKAKFPNECITRGRRINEISNTKHFIYFPSSFKDHANGDQRLILFRTDESYLKALLEIGSHKWYHPDWEERKDVYTIYGYNCVPFAKWLQYTNKELGREILREIKKRKYTGAF